MKYLFGSNCSSDEELALQQQRRFLAAELPETMQEELERREEDLEKAQEKAGLPKLLRILKWIFFVPGCICGVSVLRATVSFSEGYHNAPWAYWIAGVGLVAGGLLELADRLKGRRSKKKRESSGSQTSPGRSRTQQRQLVVHPKGS